MTNPHAEQALAQLATRFDHWRQRRTTPRARIPASLWEQAVSLTAVLPISRVAKRLRLSTNDLKKRCGADPVASSSGALPTALGFVEVTASSWFPSATEVELHRPDGARMRMHVHVPHPLLAMLIRTFLETL